MKFFPNSSPNLRLSVCICGKTSDKIGVNKNKYQNTILFVVLGSTVYFLGLLFWTDDLLRGSGNGISSKTWFEFTVTSLVVAYLLYKMIREIIKGHGPYCAARKTLIDFAK